MYLLLSNAPKNKFFLINPNFTNSKVAKPTYIKYIKAKRTDILTRRIEAFEEDNAADSYLQKFNNHLCYLT